MDILIYLLEAYDLMHGRVDDSAEISLDGDDSAVPVGEYRYKVIATGK